MTVELHWTCDRCKRVTVRPDSDEFLPPNWILIGGRHLCPTCPTN